MYLRVRSVWAVLDARRLVKIAVITPSYNSHQAWLEQCLVSVASQTVPCTHFLVFDGGPIPPLANLDHVQLLTTSGPHRDTGNAARAIGSISAISKGFDAIAYLDADNWYEPNHLEMLVEMVRNTGAVVGSSSRTLFTLDGELLGKCPEVDGNRFVDTNCLFIGKPAFSVVAEWYMMPRTYVDVGDRVVWAKVQQHDFRRAHHNHPTVNYRTSYRVHYEHFGKPPPPGAKSAVGPKEQ